MTDSNGVQWFCHRCARKDELELDADPVMLRVCDGCKVENWTRPLSGAKVPVAIVGPDEDGEPVLVEVETVEEPEPEPEVEIEAETVPEPEDPYKGMTKAQLLEELAKRG